MITIGQLLMILDVYTDNSEGTRCLIILIIALLNRQSAVRAERRRITQTWRRSDHCKRSHCELSSFPPPSSYISNMTKIHQKKAFLGPFLFSLLTLLITEAERAVLGFSKQHPKVELAEDWDRLQRTRRCQNQNYPMCARFEKDYQEKSNIENKCEFILDGDQVNMVQQLRKENGKRLLTLLLCICPGEN